ncbi:MAG: NAD-dependent epimerase/dehydratase family protein [Bacteriovoracaceae bacterium]|jgi:nucleoside-diphosphate-sugar epimerase|nr:NAD-dependent epimerase/dehydratase family protein [Bacteriovoracaceae bacterium]
MKILVTGGGGFLGRYICRDLKELGHEVYSFSRNHYDHLDEIDVSTIRGSLTDLDSIDRALEGIEAVFHVAAIAGVWGKKDSFYKTNYEGTKNLVDACKKKGIKYFINTSSPSVVFEKEDLCGVGETIPYPKKFLTHYAHSKALAEQYVMKACGDSFLAVSLRPHLIFGKEDPHIIPRVLQSARAGRLKVVGDGTNLVDIIYVENAAKAHVDAFLKLKEDPSISANCYFIGQEKPVNLWDFINKILVLKEEEPIVDKISFKKAFRIGAVLEILYKIAGIHSPQPPMTRFVACQLAKSHYFDHSKAIKDFNYTVKYNTDDAISLSYSS